MFKTLCGMKSFPVHCDMLWVSVATHFAVCSCTSVLGSLINVFMFWLPLGLTVKNLAEIVLDNLLMVDVFHFG